MEGSIKENVNSILDDVKSISTRVGSAAVPVSFGLGLLDVVASKLGVSTGVLDGALGLLTKVGVPSGIWQGVALVTAFAFWYKTRKR